MADKKAPEQSKFAGALSALKKNGDPQSSSDTQKPATMPAEVPGEAQDTQKGTAPAQAVNSEPNLTVSASSRNSRNGSVKNDVIKNVPAKDVSEQRGPGRAPGKRSDPDYQVTTVILRRDTKRQAIRRLEDTGAADDLSDLIEQLLSGWLQQA